jgi:hypothetical protein
MSKPNFNIKAFLDHFDLADMHGRYPNAGRLLTGGLFISHAGLDSERINDEIVLPVVYDRFADGVFMHSRQSGAAEIYRDFVAAALRWCDKYLVVVSDRSLANEWVRAEVAWMVAKRRRPIVQCLFDHSDPAQLHPALSLQVKRGLQLTRRRAVTVDFRGELEVARSHLAAILDEFLLRSPYQRCPPRPWRNKP